jgi:hypothetical protein
METRTLPCKLTPAELDQRRDRLVELTLKETEAEQAKKDAAKAHNTAIAEIKSEAKEVSLEIHDRAELREVEVRREKDFVQGFENVIRCDTGEVVEIRALTPQERQVEAFPFEGSDKRRRPSATAQ